MSALVAFRVESCAESSISANDILSHMPYRSPDGTSVWAHDNVSLGFGFMRTLPEDPLTPTIFEDGGCYLVADARLDNRDDICRDLEFSEPQSVSDGQLLLRAYKAWGVECVKKIIGDFAFIIYDQSLDRIFAARDHLGIRPLFFRYNDKGIVLATELKVLLDPGLPFNALTFDNVNLDQIADFICHRPHPDHSTPYQGLHRLKAGHALTYLLGAPPVVESYWDPVSKDISSGDNAPAVLRELLLKAVKCRLRSAASPAVLLSGGLDSSSIAVCAEELARREDGRKVSTFSIVFDETPAENERPYIEAVLRGRNFDAHFLHLDDYAPLSELEDMLSHQGQLFNAPSMMLSNELHKNLAIKNFRVFLDGHGGDEVISHGNERLHELASERRWYALWRELRLPDGEPLSERLKAAYLYVLSYGRFPGVRTLRRLTRWHLSKAAKTQPNGLGALLVPHDRGRNNYATEIASNPHLAQLRAPYMEEANEMLEMAAAKAGTQPCFPFFDKRVVEFCISLPPQSKRDKGWSRLILREAMEGLLPPEIQWRNNKFDFSGHLARGMMKHHRTLIDDIVRNDVDRVSGYVDLPYTKAIYEKAKSSPSTFRGSALLHLWRTVSLSLWLRQLNVKTGLK